MVFLEGKWKPRVQGNLGVAELIKRDKKFTWTPNTKAFGDVRLFISFSLAFQEEIPLNLWVALHFLYLSSVWLLSLLSIVMGFLSSQGRNFKIIFFFWKEQNPVSSLVFLVSSSSLSLELELLEVLQLSIRQNYFHLVITSLNSNITLVRNPGKEVHM